MMKILLRIVILWQSLFGLENLKIYPNTVYGHISDLITVFGRSDLSSLTSSS